MLWLCLSRLAVERLPFRRWRSLLGTPMSAGSRIDGDGVLAAELAASVERAAARLPFHTKCLPRALTLHAMMRRRRVPGILVIGVLDGQSRGDLEDLHAWVEAGGSIAIGAIDAPFHPIVRFG